MHASKSAQAYKAGLAVARRNLKRASDAGLLIVMGTDAGRPRNGSRDTSSTSRWK